MWQVQQFINDGELDETEKDEDDAGRHPDIYSLEDTGVTVQDVGPTLV